MEQNVQIKIINLKSFKDVDRAMLLSGSISEYSELTLCTIGSPGAVNMDAKLKV